MNIITQQEVPLFKAHPAQFLKDLQTLTDMNCEVDTSSKHVVICAMPKSAGTFITNTLTTACIPEYLKVSMAESFELEEVAKRLDLKNIDYEGSVIPTHLLCFPKILIFALANQNTISQHHIIANIQTIWNFKTFRGLIPIVTTRNIPDALVSLRDDWVKAHREMSDFQARYNFDGVVLKFCTKATLDKFISGSFEYQMDFIIDICASWFFEFIYSWEEVKRQNILKVLFLSYENLVKDEYKTIAEAIKFIKEDIAEDKIRSTINIAKGDRRAIRFNVGKVGRGRECLTSRQKKNLRRIGQYYADNEILMKYL